MADLFVECASTQSDGQVVMDAASLLCISNQFATLEASEEKSASDFGTWIIILCTTLIFFMQAGFAMVCAGCVRKKNLQNTMLKNLLDICGSATAFFSVGYAFAYGGEGEGKSFVGNTKFFGMGTDNEMAFWFMQYTFSAASATIVAGTIAERTKMSAYICYSVVLSSFVYPVIVHSIWSEKGFLSAFAKDPLGGVGVIDFAGSGVVHITGGSVALLAAVIVGARSGRFYNSQGHALDPPKAMKGHSTALQLLGTLILWFGWYGFNCGSALLLGVEYTGQIAGRVAINTTLSAAMGAFAAMLTDAILLTGFTGDFALSIEMAMNGCLSGLVAITAGCGTVENWAAVVIGLVAGLTYLVGHYMLLKLKIDDVVDGVPVHFMNGSWGMIATGLFTRPQLLEVAFGSGEKAGLWYTWDFTLLGNQVLAVTFIVGWSMAVMAPFFIFMHYMDWLRTDEMGQLFGLDLSYHNGALPEAATEVKQDIENFKQQFREQVQMVPPQDTVLEHSRDSM